MANDDQVEVWDSTAAGAWIRYVDEFDVTLNPFGHAVMDQLELEAGERVLDIGCGVGTTSIELASRVSPGAVVGADISPRMVAEASRRAVDRGVENVEFLVRDAQIGDFGDQAFDVAFSRVGVMFFEDPTAAFTNVAGSMKPGGRLGFVCFQNPLVNPFISVPLLTALQHLGLPMPPIDGPGPFSLADPDRTNEILTAAGFDNIRIDAGPNEAIIPVNGDLEATAIRLLEQNPYVADRFTRLNPNDAADLAKVVGDALVPHRSGDEIRMDAGTWVVLAERRS